MTKPQDRVLRVHGKIVVIGLTIALTLIIFVLALSPMPQVPGTDKTHYFMTFAAPVLSAALLHPWALW